MQILDYTKKAFAVLGETKNHREALKELGGKFNPRLSCGPGWIFSNSRKLAVENFLNSLNCNSPVKNEFPLRESSEKFLEALEEYAILRNDTDYFSKKYFVGALKIRSGFILGEKRHIITDFWFHDEGYNYEFYKDVTSSKDREKEYFFSKNLNSIYSEEKVNEFTYFIISQNQTLVFGEIGWLTDYFPQKEIFTLTAEEREELREFYKWQRENFLKRLQIYFKKYGSSKLQFSTFWANR